jgi:hypothetical protein
MSFILGLLIGFIAAIGLAAFGLWWIVMRANKEAAAKFLQGCALVLAYKKPAPVVMNAKEEGKKKPVPADVRSY